MKNKYFIYVFLLVLSFSSINKSSAQLNSTAKVSLEKFDAIYAAGPNLITLHSGEKYGIQDLKVYDYTGKELNAFTLTHKIGYTIESIIDLKEVSVLFLRAKKSNLLMTLDNNGKEVNRMEWEEPDFKDTKLIKATEEKFYLIGSIKDGSPGYSVKSYNKALQEEWSYVNIPEKNKFFFELAAVDSKGSLAILYRIKNSNYNMQFIDNQGVVLTDNALKLDGFSKYSPYFLEFSATGLAYLVADYGIKDDDFFSMRTTMNVKTFSKVGAEINNQDLVYSNFFVNESPVLSLRILDLIENNNQTQLVGEAYSTSKRIVSETSSGSTTPVKVPYYDILLGDLYLLNAANLNGDYARIWKPKRKLSFEGLGSYESTDGLCSKLEEFSLFGYQFKWEGKFVVRGFSQNLEYINELDINEPYDVAITRKYWGKPISEQAVYSNNQILTASYSYNSSFGGKKDLNRNGIYNLDNSIVVYYYNSVTRTLEFFTYK